MGNVVEKIELNSAGMIALFRDPAIQSAVTAAAEAVQRGAGYGHNVSAGTGQYRAGARVWADAPSAIKRNLEDNVLIKALTSVLPDTEAKG